MNAIRTPILSAFKRVWLSNNNRNVQKFVKNSIPILQITNASQRILCYYSTDLSTIPTGPINKDILARKKLDEYLEDPNNKKLYQMIQLEIEFLQQSGERVPNNIRDRDMLELILVGSRNKRRKYLDFLFTIEKKKENQKMKANEKIEKKPEPQEQKRDLPNFLQYTLGHNSPFLRISSATINKLYNWNLMKAMMYGSKVVIDCGFEDKMSRAETKNCAKQLMLGFGANRIHKNPLDITFCNVNKDGYLHQELHSYIPTMHNRHFPMTITTKSYLEIFNRDKLVYLTPDSTETLDYYDYDAIYIIGAIVDKLSNEAFTLHKAEQEQIRHVKLPISKYIHLSTGTNKNLTLNQVIEIMADFQHIQDWNYAFRHIPTRKLHENRIANMEKRIKEFCQENKFNKIMNKISIDKFDIKSRKKFRNNI